MGRIPVVGGVPEERNRRLREFDRCRTNRKAKRVSKEVGEFGRHCRDNRRTPHDEWYSENVLGGERDRALEPELREGVIHEPARVSQQCRERRAEPVLEKANGNFCEYFDFIRREWKPKSEINSREVSARERMNKLFGDG